MDKIISDPASIKGKMLRVNDSMLPAFGIVTASVDAIPTSVEVAVHFLIERATTIMNAIDKVSLEFVEDKYATYFDMLGVLEEL